MKHICFNFSGDSVAHVFIMALPGIRALSLRVDSCDSDFIVRDISGVYIAFIPGTYGFQLCVYAQ
jgi:hypothetical protein